MQVLCIYISFETATKKNPTHRSTILVGRNIKVMAIHVLLTEMHIPWAHFIKKIDVFFTGTWNFRLTIVFQLSLARRTISVCVGKWKGDVKIADAFWIIASLDLLRLLPQPCWAGGDFWEGWFCLSGRSSGRGRKSWGEGLSCIITVPLLQIQWFTGTAWWPESELERVVTAASPMKGH